MKESLTWSGHELQESEDQLYTPKEVINHLRKTGGEKYIFDDIKIYPSWSLIKLDPTTVDHHRTDDGENIGFENAQHLPIVVYDGMVHDGNHRATWARNNKKRVLAFVPTDQVQSLRDEEWQNLPESLTWSGHELYHITPTKNLPSIRKIGLQPYQNAEMGDAPGVYFFVDRESAEEALYNWAGDKFDDDEPLSMLKVNPEGLNLHSDPTVGYEVWSSKPVPPQNIQSVESLDESLTWSGHELSPEKARLIATTLIQKWSDEEGDYDPQAMCKEISEDLARELEKQGFQAHVVRGTFRIDQSFDDADGVDLLNPTHYWVQVGSNILDITAQQFQDEVDEQIPQIVFAPEEQLTRYNAMKIIESLTWSGHQLSYRTTYLGMPIPQISRTTALLEHRSC